MREVSGKPNQCQVLVVAGADKLPRRHLERLTDQCERRQVKLVFLCRHLRSDALALLGGGTAAFMKLGNHLEAEQAASYIGRGHRFEISQLGVSQGGTETHTWARTENTVTGASEHHSESATESVIRGRSRNVQVPAFGLGAAYMFLGYSSGKSEYEGEAHTRGTVRGSNWSRAWGTSQAYASSTNWHESAIRQRVYEYRVEPRTLQDLPDYAMLVVEPTPGGPALQAAECDPDRVTLPRVTMQPLPDVAPAPDVVEPASPQVKVGLAASDC